MTVEAFIREHEPGAKLPPDRTIASACNVSIMTVRRAMTALAHDGVIMRIKGAGSFAPGHARNATLAPGATPLYRVIADQLRDSIRHGVIRMGVALPLRKELAFRFGCSVETINAAVNALEQQELITRRGRRLIAGRPLSKPPARAKAYIISPDQERYAWLRAESEGAPVIAGMERELNAAGVSLGFLPLKTFKSLCRSDDERVYRAAGFVFSGSLQGMLDEREVRALTPFLKEVLRKNAGSQVRAICITRQSIVRIRRVLYFSFSHLVTIRMRTVARTCADWPYRRIRIVCTDDRAGQGPGRMLFDMLRLRSELEHFAPHASVDIAVRTGAGAGIQPLSERMRGKLTHHLKPAEYLPRLSKYRRVTDPEVGAGVFEFDRFDDIAPDDQIPSLLCAQSASTALLLLEMMKSRGRGVSPHGVICLEENSAVAAAGITTALLDESRAGYLLAHALLRDMPVALSHRGFIDPPGCVLLRDTTPLNYLNDETVVCGKNSSS